MDKRFMIILAAVIVIFGVIFWTTKSKTDTVGKNGSTSAASQHIEGNKASGVTFVEYGDYQCPYCGQYYPLVKQVEQQYADKISYQFRNFPLVQLHPNAMAAARAAEAASLQGKFWQMHDLLYQNQNTWASASSPSSFFDQYAQQIGLNLSTFHSDQNSAQVLATINADQAAGQAQQVDATPTFFINGKKIDNPPTDVAGFAKLIDAAIATKK
ncbi:MAG: thioredoxin domain-containing protein [Candidatus Saccharimonadales bacterium]